jgi:hypothetical protein
MQSYRIVDDGSKRLHVSVLDGLQRERPVAALQRPEQYARVETARKHQDCTIERLRKDGERSGEHVHDIEIDHDGAIYKLGVSAAVSVNRHSLTEHASTQHYCDENIPFITSVRLR